MVTLAIPITKTDDSTQCVFGWASVAVTKTGETLVDLQGDTIDIYDLEEAFQDYVTSSRALNFAHAGAQRGTLVECMVFTPEKIAALGIPEGVLPLGALVTYHLPDPDDYAQAKAEGLLMFSIEGTGVREAV